ncbi:MAG: hypothetical protein ACPLW8_06080, partial [Candidatus Bathyarchaeales archaeon]
MPRPRKYVDTVVKSFCVEREVYERLRVALAGRGRSISEEVNELLRKRLAELEGEQKPGEADSKLGFDAGDVRFLKDGRVSLPWNPNQIIFI